MKKDFPWLALILITAFLVRFLGFWVASYYVDEATLLYRARQIMTGEELFNPHFVETMIAYGMIVSYIQAFFMKLVYFFGHLVYGWNSVGDVYSVLKLTARFLSVLAGTGAVYFTYLSAKKLFNEKAALFSGLVLAFSFNHVAQSKYALVDIYISLFLIVAFYFSVIILSKKKNLLKAYVFGSIFSTLAFALKYNFPVFIPILTAHSFSVWRSLKIQPNKWFIYLLKWWRKEIFIFVAVAVGVFIIINPYLLANPTNYIWQLKTILQMSWNFPFGARDFDNIPNIFWYFEYIAKVGLYYPFFVFVLGGIVVALTKYRFQAVLLLSYPVGQLILLEIYTPRTDRYPVWWLPMLTIFAGLFLWKSLFFPRFKKIWRLVLVFLIIIPIGRVLVFDFAVAVQKDTRQEAKEFLLGKEQPIYFLVDIDGKFLNIKGGQFLGTHQLIRSSFDPKSEFPHNIFRYPGEYVVISSFNYEEYLHLLRHNPEGVIFNQRPAFTQEWLFNYINEARLVADFMNKSKLVKEFSRFWFENNFLNSVRIPGGGTDVGVSYNPTIKIYKIPKLTDQIPSIRMNYYPEPIAPSGLEILLPIVGAQVVFDQDGGREQIILLQKDESRAISVIKTTQAPFPPGEYLVKISLRIPPGFVVPKRIYGYITFGDQKIKENVSYQKIKGENLKMTKSYQTISLPFKLSQISNTAIELTWLDQNPVMVEKIEIEQGQ